MQHTKRLQRGNDTSSWYGDREWFPCSATAFFTRGGFYNEGSVAGAFGYYGNNGNAFDVCGFRPVLVAP